MMIFLYLFIFINVTLFNRFKGKLVGRNLSNIVKITCIILLNTAEYLWKLHSNLSKSKDIDLCEVIL